MNLKEISKDIYDVDAWMDEQYGKVGSPEREELRKEAYAYCVGQIIHDARKQEKNEQKQRKVDLKYLLRPIVIN
jgi:toxin-antitoxin system, antitoxin component, xre family